MLSWFKKSKLPEPAPPQTPSTSYSTPAAKPPTASSRKRETKPENIAEDKIQRALKEQAAELDLSGLGLTKVPDSIGRLEKLTSLCLSDNSLTTLPLSMAKLKSLAGIDLSLNALTVVPEILREVPNLRRMCFSRCQISVLPAWLGELRSLRLLDLRGNDLRELPDSIGLLPVLESLDLRDNRLERLPAEGLRDLPKLKTLHLHGNEKLGIPREILGGTGDGAFGADFLPANPRDILDFYERGRGEVRPLNEARMIVLGRGGVGKTCVVNRLVRDRFLETSRTEGIHLEPWKLRLGDDEVKLPVWDFGGQEIMRMTRQFFLSHRSLYLLVLEARRGGEDADAEYWLELIESIGGESPVIVVLNKIGEQPFVLDYRGLRAKHPSIRAFVQVDCHNRTGIDELRTTIERETAALQDLRAPFPAPWMSIKDRLASMAERGERFMEYETYTQICANLGESDPAAQDQLAGYLHALGIALSYKDDPRLCEPHILSPHWLTNAIHGVLNWPELAAQRGVLRPHDLGYALDSTAYPRGKHPFLLNLMRGLEVCFAYPADPQGRYLVPQWLGTGQTTLADGFDLRECLHFEYRYNFLPDGVLPRFIVRTHALSGPEGRWRTGVVLEFEGNRALVRADAQARKISIAVNGPAEGRRRLLAVIRSDFEHIHADRPRLVVTAMVMVPGQPGWGVPYEELCVFERSGVRSAPRVFDGQLVSLNIPEMLAAVELPGTPRRVDEPFAHAEARSVFISYAHQDEPWRAELETHLKLLQREGLISMWTDRRIPPGTDWGGQIDRHLNGAEIILVLISADFLASHYCYDLEMNRALERHEAGDAVVIPIVVRDVDLRGAHFAHLQALPKGGKAVTLWPDRDTAWREIAGQLREVIEARQN